MVNDLAKQVIAGLSILTANLEEGRDYIDLFVPLAGQCILNKKPALVSVTDLQSQMKDTFGMQIPQNALKLVLNRAAKKRYVEFKERTYIPNLKVLSTLNFNTRYQDIVRQQNAAIKKFETFALDRFGTSLTEKEAENALLAYVQKHDMEMLDCFLHDQAPILFYQPDSTKKLDFIVSSFIAECYKSDPDGFKYIDTIVKGHFLSHTLFFPDLGQVKRRFYRTEVYFDTALLLRIVGYEGLARQATSKELLNLLYKEGAVFKCFRHTRDEVYNVLYACMLTMRKGEIEFVSPTFNYLKSAGYGASDIELELTMLDKKTEEYNIKIVDKPAYISRFQIDEGKLEKNLEQKAIYWHDKPTQRKHDVDCLSAIHQLRKGHESIYVEESTAVFVTANSTLCKVGSEYFVVESYIDRSSVPPAITDYALTTLLWLKTPMSAPQLPMKFIIAECYAAVEPSERLWRKYIETASRLKETQKISENEYYLLRYSQLAHKELMGLTMGDEDVITEGSVGEILEKVKMEIRKADLAALENERRILEETKKDGLAKLEEERRIREETERKLEFERTLHTERMDSLKQNLERKSQKAANLLSIVAFIIVSGLITLGAIYGFIKWYGEWWNYLILAAYLILLILSILNLIFGVTIRDYRARFEVYLKKRIELWLKKWFLPKL